MDYTETPPVADDEAPSTTPRVFSRTVAEHGGRVAMRYKEYGLWHDITWTEYFQTARNIGAALIAMGLEKGQCVSIIGDNCPEWVMIDMGVQMAGGVSVGIYTTNAWPEVEYVVTHSESVFLFAENEEQLDKWLQFRKNAPLLKKVIVWDTKGLREFQDPLVMTYDDLLAHGRKQPTDAIERRSRNISLQDLSVLIYTSGTTGPPKGAMLTHRNVTWMAEAIEAQNPMQTGDEVLSFLPLCHIFERLFSVFAHIRHAYVVNFVEKPDTVTDNMSEVSPTVGYAVPRIWEKYYSTIQIRMSEATWFKHQVFNLALKIGRKRADFIMAMEKVPYSIVLLFWIAHLAVFRKLKERLGFERIRVAYSGAAPISPDVLHFYQAIGMNLIEGYGQTEGTGVTCTSRIGKTRFGTVGTPIPGTALKIADDGEIMVRSPGIFAGYYKNEEATRETLVDGWLLSGDVGTLDEHGYLKITDRKKDIIITAGGKNISPQYIENMLKASVYINDAVIIGDRRKFLTALVMIDEDNVVKFAQDNKIQFSTYRDLTQHSKIKDLIQGEVDTVNRSLARVENIRKFTILPKKLFEEDGEVTPTLKVKRKYVYAAFSDIIEAMYQS
ncbi:MAG TPA: AMP-binding protein [Desulfosalsimonadaceae bacterium]|nr:AMP-binding protein [Desulfosalsimonadaceae bacterium]